MKTKNTYNPEDIEALLMNKTFDELLPEEKDFVLQHVENKDEYSLLRTTLLAIKKSSENDELIEANPQIKEDLLLLMDNKARRGAGWFNLNGLWSFLFPEDVFMFKKPGFQLASFAVVLFFGFYFSGKFLNLEPNNLVINNVSKQKKEEVKKLFNDSSTEIQEKIIIKEQENNNIVPKEPTRMEEQVAFNQLDVKQDIAPAPDKQRIIMDETLGDIANVSDKEVNQKPMEDTQLSGGVNSFENVEAEYFEEDVVMDEVTTKSITQTDSYIRVAEVSKVSTGKTDGLIQNKIKNIESQSLKDNEAVIDLLYVTF